MPAVRALQNGLSAVRRGAGGARAVPELRVPGGPGRRRNTCAGSAGQPAPHRTPPGSLPRRRRGPQLRRAVGAGGSRARARAQHGDPPPPVRRSVWCHPRGAIQVPRGPLSLACALSRSAFLPRASSLTLSSSHRARARANSPAVCSTWRIHQRLKEKLQQVRTRAHARGYLHAPAARPHPRTDIHAGAVAGRC